MKIVEEKAANDWVSFSFLAPGEVFRTSTTGGEFIKIVSIYDSAGGGAPEWNALSLTHFDVELFKAEHQVIRLQTTLTIKG